MPKKITDAAGDTLTGEGAQTDLDSADDLGAVEQKTDVVLKVSADPIQVRILSEVEVNGVKITSGRVAVVDAETAAGLIAGGVADDNADAVAYALTENDKVIDPLTV